MNYNKREFYYHKTTKIDNIKSYEDVKKYRDETCGGKLELYTHQAFLFQEPLKLQGLTEIHYLTIEPK